MIFAIIFEVTIFAAPKKVQLVTIFVFCKFPLPSTVLLSTLLYSCSGVPAGYGNPKKIYFCKVFLFLFAWDLVAHEN